MHITPIKSTFHKVLRGVQAINVFHDPIPYDDSGVMRYKEGLDEDEKHLSSKIEDPPKKDHKIPFTLSTQTEKNVGFLVRCEECNKPYLLFAKRKLKDQELTSLKRILNELVYSCGSSFAEYDAEKEDSIMNKVFVKENLSCNQIIELSYYSCEIFKAVCIHCG